MPLDQKTLARLDGATNRARMATFPSRHDITEIVLCLRELITELGARLDMIEARLCLEDEQRGEL